MLIRLAWRLTFSTYFLHHELSCLGLIFIGKPLWNGVFAGENSLK